VRDTLVGAATTPTVAISRAAAAGGKHARSTVGLQGLLHRRRRHPDGRREGSVHASIIDMTLRLPVDEVLFDELRTDFLPRAAQHPGFRGFQYVLAEHGRAVGILWYQQPEDLDGITQLVGTWFQDHIAPRLAGPETAVRGRVVVNMTPPHTTKT
jgi:hypothetical protein